MKKIVLIFVLVFQLTCLFAQKDVPYRVILLGVDGLNTKDLMNTPTHHIDSLMELGSWTMNAQAVLPTSSSPNWAAMIMGAPPELTRVFANGWHRKKEYVPNPTCDSFPKFFPTLFYELGRQHPKSRIGAIHQWFSWKSLIVNRHVTKRAMTFISPEYTMRVAKRYFTLRKPELMFVHLDHCDHAGHKYGHGSAEYIEAVKKTDKLVGELVAKLKAKGLYETTYILLTSDHGGIGHGHGGNTPEEVNVPWILVGPNVKADHHITNTVVNTYDTAVTLAHILGIQANSCWTGKVITEVFD